MVSKTYSELIQDLETASIALRYCTDASERPTLIAAKKAAEDAIEAFDTQEEDT